jgi:putative transposase
VDYFDWHNIQHHHSGLAGFTPEQVFTEDHIAVAAQKQAALDAMYRQHPERFTAGHPKVAMPPTVVAINPVPLELRGTEEDRVNFPTLQAARAN